MPGQEFDRDAFIAECNEKNEEFAEESAKSRQAWSPPAAEQPYICELVESFVTRASRNGSTARLWKPTFRIVAVPDGVPDGSKYLNRRFGEWFSDEGKRFRILTSNLTAVYGSTQIPKSYGMALLGVKDKFIGHLYQVRVKPPRKPGYKPDVFIVGEVRAAVQQG